MSATPLPEGLRARIEQPRSLSTRLLASVTVLLLLFFGVTILALDLLFQDLSRRAIQERLEVHALALLSASEEDDTGALRPVQPAEPRFENPGSGLYAEIRRADGALIWRSGSLTGTGIIFPIPRIGERRFGELAGTDGAPVLALSMGIDWQFRSGEMQPFVYSVAESMDPYYEQLSRLRGRLFGWFGAIMVVLLGAFAILLRRLLAPLRRVEREIEAIEAGELDELGGGYPRELLGITTNLNALLRSERERLTRYRNTLGNLAHSFKTPLAVMRNLLTNASHELPAARALDAQVSRMDDIVKYQLRRAAASGGTGFGRMPVDVEQNLAALREALLKVYMERGLSCELRVDPGATYSGDREDLTEIAGNLMDNAFKWARRRVRVTAERVTRTGTRRDGLRLIIEDDGPGIPETARPTVVERGTRLDERVSGQGIGLSVVRELVQLSQGTLRIETSMLGGARVEVDIPPG